MADNYDYISGYLDDLNEGRGLSGKIVNNTIGLEVSHVEPVIDATSVAEVKNFHNINTDKYDDQIRLIIPSALVDIEKYTGRTIISRTVTAYWKQFNTGADLPYPDINSITSVTSIDDDGTETALTSEDYTVLGNNEKFIQIDGSDNQIKIVYEAGYGKTLSSLPASLRMAVIRQCAVYMSDLDIGIGEVAFDRDTNLDVRAQSLAKRYKVYGKY